MNEKTLQNKICAILLREWDPIGVRNVSQAQGEYDQYAVAPTPLLRRDASLEELENLLLQFERGNLGLPGDSARARDVAMRLKSIAAI